MLENNLVRSGVESRPMTWPSLPIYHHVPSWSLERKWISIDSTLYVGKSSLMSSLQPSDLYWYCLRGTDDNHFTFPILKEAAASIENQTQGSLPTLSLVTWPFRLYWMAKGCEESDNQPSLCFGIWVRIPGQEPFWWKKTWSIQPNFYTGFELCRGSVHKTVKSTVN